MATQMKWRTVFKDKMGNRIVYGKNAIAVKNAEGTLLNPSATKKFLRENSYRIKKNTHAVKLQGGKR